MHHHPRVLHSASLTLVRKSNATACTECHDTLDEVGPLLDTFLALSARKDLFDGASS